MFGIIFRSLRSALDNPVTVQGHSIAGADEDEVHPGRFSAPKCTIKTERLDLFG